MRVLDVSARAVGTNLFNYAIVLFDEATKRTWVIHRSFEELQKMRKKVLGKLDSIFSRCGDCISEGTILAKVHFPRMRIMLSQAKSLVVAESRALELRAFLNVFIARLVSRRPTKHTSLCPIWKEAVGFIDEFLHGLDADNNSQPVMRQKLVPLVSSSFLTKTVYQVEFVAVLKPKMLDTVFEKDDERDEHIGVELASPC